MKTSSSLLIALAILLFLPFIWCIYKVFGLGGHDLDGFWLAYWPWAGGFVVLIGTWYLITKFKKP